MNTADYEDVREQYSVAGLPTVIVAKAGGEEIDRTLGFVETKEFIQTVENYNRGIGTLTAMLAAEKESKNDPEALFLLGEKLYQHSRFQDADMRFEAVSVVDTKNKSGFADDALYNRVLTSRKQENWDQGIAHARRLITSWPNSEFADDAAIYVGYLAAKAGRNDDAIAGYKDYLKNWPKGEDVEFAKNQIEALEAESEEGES